MQPCVCSPHEIYLQLSLSLRNKQRNIIKNLIKFLIFVSNYYCIILKYMIANGIDMWSKEEDHKESTKLYDIIIFLILNECILKYRDDISYWIDFEEKQKLQSILKKLIHIWEESPANYYTNQREQVKNKPRFEIIQSD